MKKRQGKAGNRDSYCRNNKGMALVLTLLVVAILTAMVVEFAYGVYINTNALHNWQTAQRLSLAAKSAARLGARLIAESSVFDPYTSEPTKITQKIPFEEIDGIILLEIENENSKFNLNSLVYAAGCSQSQTYMPLSGKCSRHLT